MPLSSTATPSPSLSANAGTSHSVQHLLIPFASASDPNARALLPQLKLLNLSDLLALLAPEHTDTGDDHTLSPPHERALARSQGLLGPDGLAYGDGLIPWAAAHSDTPQQPQAWFMPCHFQVGMEQVNLLPGEQMGFSESDSRALLAALAPFAAEDGIALRFETPTRWHASGEALRGLACASLDRVSGRQVDAWMAESPANPAGAQLLKRLQSEAQMLFYTHPVNDAREAAGQPSINGFWVCGAGAHTGTPLLPAAAMPEGLRQAALRADWAAWQAAWEALDATDLHALLQAARQGRPVALTLCGERSAQRWVNAPAGAPARLGRFFKQLLGKTPAHVVLEAL
jgi:hypothetical protein